MQIHRHFVHNFGPKNWLQFPNDFTEKSFLWRKIVWIPTPVGRSDFGMCGGMASTVLDFFYHNKTIPSRKTPPSSQDDPVLFQWIKQRQIESITMIDLYKYFTLLFTGGKSDKKTLLQSWEHIKKLLTENHPVILGLQRAKVDAFYTIHQIGRIVHNHQVVAWGFEEKDGNIDIFVYDPNHPENRDTKISFTENVRQPARVTCSDSDLHPIHTFFMAKYTQKKPSEIA